MQCICCGCRIISVTGACYAGNYDELKSFSNWIGSLVGVEVGSLVEVGSFVGGCSCGCGGGSVGLLFGIRFLPLGSS